MNKLVLLVLCMFSLLLVSCGMTEDEFSTDYTKAACKKDASCDETVDSATCYDQTKPWMDLAMDSCSGFDSDNAEKCVDCVKGLTCEQWAIYNDDEVEGEYCTSCDKVCD